MQLSLVCQVIVLFSLMRSCMVFGRNEKNQTQKKPGSAAVAFPGIIASVGMSLVEKVQGVGRIVHVVDALPDRNQAEQCAGTRRTAAAVE